jgi:hypothetical protein
MMKKKRVSAATAPTAAKAATATTNHYNISLDSSPSGTNNSTCRC